MLAARRGLCCGAQAAARLLQAAVAALREQQASRPLVIRAACALACTAAAMGVCRAKSVLPASVQALAAVQAT